jgi:cytochrome c oxidase cbb3-type subunit 1
MSNVTVWFIKCAMIYLAISVLLGLHMSASGPLYPYKPIHTHLNLLGWMSMMIFGVGYHILPRFSGAPLWSERLSVWHLWTSNIGLLGMCAGWFVISTGWGGGGYAVLAGFSILEGASVALFVVNMFKTIKAAPPLTNQ